MYIRVLKGDRRHYVWAKRLNKQPRKWRLERSFFVLSTPRSHTELAAWEWMWPVDYKALVCFEVCIMIDLIRLDCYCLTANICEHINPARRSHSCKQSYICQCMRWGQAHKQLLSCTFCMTSLFVFFRCDRLWFRQLVSRKPSESLFFAGHILALLWLHPHWEIFKPRRHFWQCARHCNKHGTLEQWRHIFLYDITGQIVDLQADQRGAAFCLIFSARFCAVTYLLGTVFEFMTSESSSMVEVASILHISGVVWWARHLVKATS